MKYRLIVVSLGHFLKKKRKKRNVLILKEAAACLRFKAEIAPSPLRVTPSERKSPPWGGGGAWLVTGRRCGRWDTGATSCT